MNLKMFKILKNKNFSLLIFGELVSLFGTQFQDFALSLYVLKITGSATLFASILAITLLPQIILGPMAGVFVDWFDRKKTIVYLNLLNGVVILLLSIAFLTSGQLKLGYIYAAVFVMAINQLMFAPAVGTVIPSITKESDLVAANSVNSIVKSSASLLSPVMAGAIYSIFGLLPILAFNSVSFIIAAFCETFIFIPKNERHITKFDYHQFNSDFSAGVKFLKSEKLIFALAISGFIINFAIGPTFSIGFPFIIKDVLKGTDAQYGLVCSAAALGEIAGPILAGIAAEKKDFPHIFVYGIIGVTGITGLMVFAVCPAFTGLFKLNLAPLILMGIIAILIAITVMIVNINSSVMFQKKVPNEMLGRVGAAMNTINLASLPLGQLLFGLLFDNIQAYLVILISVGVLFTSFLTFKNILKYGVEEAAEYKQNCIGGEV